jgi:hypothetical protein
VVGTKEGARDHPAGSNHQGRSWGVKLGARAAEALATTPRRPRRIRREIEQHGMEAVMERHGGRPRRTRIKPGTIALLCRLKGEASSIRTFRCGTFMSTSLKARRKGLLQLAASDAAGSGVAEKESGRGQYRRERRPLVGIPVLGLLECSPSA